MPADYAPGSIAVSMRAIADHARAAAFLIADGVFPDKTGREYVLRRIMRRAIYHGWLLGIDKPFLAGLAGHVIEEMGDVYPELVERESLILEVTDLEEKRFRETLERGMRILDEEAGKLSGKVIPGDGRLQALRHLSDFPLDLTRVIGAGRGLDVDEAGFETRDGRAAQARRLRGLGRGRRRGGVPDHRRAAWARPSSSATRRPRPERDRRPGRRWQGGRSVAARAPGAVAVICRETPFYGEQGGQIGDTGTATGAARRARGDRHQAAAVHALRAPRRGQPGQR